VQEVKDGAEGTPPAAPPGLRRERFSLTPRSSLVLLGLVVWITLWGEHARDPDFPLPNPFAWLAVIPIAIFVATGLVRSRFARTLLRVGLGVVPPAVVLMLEVWLSASDIRVMESRVVVVDDPLLRYHYRPGVEGVNHLGLWDDEHAIPKPEGVFRIAVVGDSVPNDGSIPREDRFHRVLERELVARHPIAKRIEVVNVSCEGFNTLQEVRLLERIGLKYQPDLVVLAYVLNDPFLQNGGYRRLGNSFFAFRFASFLALTIDGGFCPTFDQLNQGYAYQLIVRGSLERLRMVSHIHGLGVIVAALPLVERFDDPACLAAYDRVGGIARDQGFGFLRVVDAFAGEDYQAYLKSERFDVTHPNAAGHARMGTWLAEQIAEHLAARAGQ
jgi:hypothetical protein